MTRLLLAAIACILFVTAAYADVNIEKTPGIQPQAVMDAKGNLHLLYFQGEAKAGNLMYVRRDAGQQTFSKALRVNSQEGSAIATGTIRGGHIALGKNGRVHVSWNGSMKAEPKNALGGHPMMYARLNDAGTAFEPQRNLMTQTSVLDGGGTVTADTQGNVYVAWHAVGKDSAKGEGNRKVWVSISNDDGKTFAAEKSAWDKLTGACGCCGMRGFTDSKGTVYFLYRAATQDVNRGMYVLQSSDAGISFSGRQLDNWEVNTCPMSSEAMAEGPGGVVAAWDNNGGICTVPIAPAKLAQSISSVSERTAPRKHPAMAFNKHGEMILVWTEGTGWNRGGNLAWQVYDKSGNRTKEAGRRAGAIPVWGLPAVVAEPDGRFTIFH